MTIVVEDGSIVSGANSYNTLVEMRAYALARGVTLTSVDADLEVQSNNAMDFLESLAGDYKGQMVDPGTQSLQHPREYMYVYGVLVDSDTIHKNMKSAQCQLIIEQTNDVSIMANITTRPIIEEKVGPLSTKYSDRWGALSQPTLTKVNALLAPLLKTSGGDNATVHM